MKISEKIIKLRKENGLSQEEFGNKINVSRQAVSKWENEETKPDTDKIQAIAKKFNVTCEYLLNDNLEKSTNYTKVDDKKKTKKVLKITLIILIIYFLISLYKFIAFYKFYLSANSFSEENYWICQINSYDTSSSENKEITTNITKVNNKILETSYLNENTENAKIDEKGSYIPYSITYTDIDKKDCFNLYYDNSQEKYIYHDVKKDMINEEEIEQLFNNENKVKEITLSEIPSNFKEIFLASINPMYYYVDIVNREVRWYSIVSNVKKTVKLSKDYLVEMIFLKSEYADTIKVVYSYDYIQDHFKEIKNPLETYDGKIIFEE